jgi:molecular chaperone IbpA
MTTDYFLNTLALDSFRRVFFNMDPVQAKTSIGYPPYNIIESSDTDYTIEIAVAGFTKEDLEITIEQDNVLHIVANKGDYPEKNYLVRGLAARGFVKKFTLADSVVVGKTKLENGILSIHLQRVVPESKTRKLEIL